MGNVDKMDYEELIIKMKDAVMELTNARVNYGAAQARQRFFLKEILERIVNAELVKKMSDERVSAVIKALVGD